MWMPPPLRRRWCPRRRRRRAPLRRSIAWHSKIWSWRSIKKRRSRRWLCSSRKPTPALYRCAALRSKPTGSRLSGRPIRSRAPPPPSAYARSHNWRARSSAMHPTSRRATIARYSIASTRPLPRRERNIWRPCFRAEARRPAGPPGGDLLRRRAFSAQAPHIGVRHIGAVGFPERAIGGGAGGHVAFRLQRGGRHGRRVQLRGGVRKRRADVRWGGRADRRIDHAGGRRGPPGSRLVHPAHSGMGWVNEPGARRAAAPAGVVDTPISPAAPPDIGAPFPDAAAQLNAPAVPAAALQPKCDVTACAAAYRSFRESDCTYMPNADVRRLCTKGTPPVSYT